MGELNEADLNEMLGICYMSKEAGFDKIQMDVDHAIEILIDLIDMKFVGK